MPNLPTCAAIALASSLLLGAAAGCGFQLRSYSFENAVTSYAITGKTRVSVVPALRRGLAQAGVDESPRADASLVLDVLDQRRERRSISTAGSARAAEYEISYGVQYRLLDGSGNELAPPTWIRRERVYRIDRNNIVGSSEEEALLERELLRDVVGQIIRAMDTVSRNLAAADAG